MSSRATDLRDAVRGLLVAHSALESERRPCGAPLSLAHAHALLTLREATKPLSVSALARTVNIDRTNVSRLCARMETLGEIERTTDPEDGRARLLHLTSAGRKLADHVERTSAEHFSDVVNALGEQAPAVISALTTLNSALWSLRSQPKRSTP